MPITKQARERKEQRQSRKDQGICVTCGEKPAALGYRGQMMIYCLECVPVQNRVSTGMSKTKSVQKPPKRVFDVDYCFFDEQEFKVLCAKIAKLLPDGEFTIGDLIRACVKGKLGEDYVRRHLANVMWALEDEHIECVREITPKRYKRLTQPKPKATGGWNGSISSANGKKGITL